MSGFMHPMGGLESFNWPCWAIVFGRQAFGGRCFVAIPTAFVATMLWGGGFKPVLAYKCLLLKQGICLSVILMGALLSRRKHGFPVAICAGIARIISVFSRRCSMLRNAIKCERCRIRIGFAVATAIIASPCLEFGFVRSFSLPKRLLITRVTG